jgi:hypothetical protein
MAEFTVYIPDELVPDLLDAFDAVFHGREEEGYTKVQWAKRQLRRYVRGVYRRWKATEAAEAAEIAAAQQAETDSEGIDVT